MRILVVDDEDSQRNLLAGFLGKQGHNVRNAASGPAALKLLARQGAEVVITDLRMPEMNGLDFLKEILQIHPDTAVIMVTAFATVENAVEAMKAGAYDYLIKPINLEQLSLILKKVEQNLRLVTENRYLRRRLEEVSDFPELIGDSPVFKQILSDISVIAQSGSTVLIRGESGTGKELAARAIHYSSPRRDKPFLAVNCAALPETLLESELFGYEKGAFTGAVKSRIGRFELADKGTLFLDEIGDLPLTVQVKLLRAIETKTFERLGGSRSIKVDIRLIAATNRDLEHKIKEGSFREDLYYRLNVIPLILPPLRQRKKDIMPLIEHFIARFSMRAGKQIKGITPAAKDILMAYDWPGNVRELENLIERAVVMTRSQSIDTDCLFGLDISGDRQNEKDDTLNLAELERKAIAKALRKTKGNQAEAAALLGIHRNTIRAKIRQYGLK